MKCNSARPTCSRCKTLDVDCQYDVEQGVTRAESFRIKKDRQITRTADLESLVNLLRSGCDVEASTVLARLRLGDRVDDIVQSSQADSITSTREPSGQSTTQLEDASSSAVGPKDAEGEVTEVMSPFLSLMFDFNKELRLIAASNSSGIYGTTNMTMSVSQSPSEPQEPAPGIPTSRPDSVITQAWTRQTTDSHADRQACFANFFCNLPTSSGILANHYPQDIQERQLSQLSIPKWALMCINNGADTGSISAALVHVRSEILSSLEKGTSWNTLVGLHPNVAALFDENSFKEAPFLSQWAASNDFTCIASMYVFWYVMRWMISPSVETYEAMPVWVRPTPYQVFVPHMHLLDFLVWPKLRDIAVQSTALQENMEWMVEQTATVCCHWPHTIEEALHKDEVTGREALTIAAK
ncbi:unnamed protein product, partial [Alternaria alternata]